MAPLIDGFAAGSSGGGSELGRAHGSITLDTADLLRAEQTSRAVGRNIETNLSVIGRAADTVSTRLNTVGRALNSLRGEIAAIGAAGALTTVFGLNASRDIRNARIRLSQFVSTEEEAAELMRSLTDSANEFGLNLEGVFSLASSLLPVLEGNVEATDEWVKRAARLRTVLPSAQQGAELRAISEFLAGQTISLQRLFNIPPNLILEAKAAFSDAGDQLDFILERMGATEQAARDMADPIVAVRNELKLIAATGFDPILQRLREILPEVREWLEMIRETRPEVLEIGAAFAAAAAIGAPFLLFLGQALSTAQKLQQLGVLGSLGRVGAAGLIIGGAAIGTTAGVNAIARAKGDVPELETAGFWKIMAEGLKSVADLFLGFAALLAPVFQSITFALLNFANTVISVYTSLGNILTKIGGVLPDDLGGRELTQAGSAIQRAGEEAAGFVQELHKANEEALPKFRQDIEKSRIAFRDFLDGLFSGGAGGGDSAGTAVGGSVGTAGPGGLTELQLQQLAAWEEYQAQIAAIEQRGQEQRLQLTEQYEAQRTSIIAQYEKQAAREAAAFARNRVREIARTQNEIDDIRGKALSQEAKWWQELQVVIANARTESARRIAEIEADANRTREQNERTHRDNLLSAASRLDARAVADEQRRFRTQSTNFEQDLQARLEKERQNLAERIAAEEQGHTERIAAERASNEERIQAILEAQAERFAIEDEERAIRLEEQKQDHLQQLEELRKANRKRLDESKQQQKKELDQLEKQFTESNREFSDYYTKWLTTQKDEQKASLDEWDSFWKEWWRIQQSQMTTVGTGTTGGGTGTGTGTGGTPGGGTTGGGETPLTRRELERLFGRLATEANWTNAAILEFIRVSRSWTDRQLALWIEANFGYDVPGYKQGTSYVPRDQLAYLHKGEAVLKEADASVWRMLLSAFGGRQMAASYATTSNRMNVNMTFNGLGGASAGDIGDVVEKRMLQVFKRIP